MFSARIPIASDSTSATTPRISGQRYARCRRVQDLSGNEESSIAPSESRTATAQLETPRIITPSSTAWPPIGASRDATSSSVATTPAQPPIEARLRARRGARAAALGHPTLESLDPSAGIDQLLLARVKRMARRED